MNPLLLPLAVGYRTGARLRTAAYRQGWFKTRRLNRPVISVGNISAGGAGKTPLVAYLAGCLLRRGWKPGILTRGYRRRRGGDIVAIAPGNERAPDPRKVGDEPALLARKLAQVPIVVCADRYRAGRLAEEMFGVDVHILDDGFQHLALERDVNIVVLDVTQEFSDRAVLPAGLLREPCSAVARADMVVLSRVELGDPAPLALQVRRFNPHAGVFHASTSLRELRDVATGEVYAPGAWEGKPVYAFCGIGNPSAFLADLSQWKLSVVAQKVFRDHHVYDANDLGNFMTPAIREMHPAAFLTTEKDAMNLPRLPKPGAPILACVVETEILEHEEFEEALGARLQAAKVSV